MSNGGYVVKAKITEALVKTRVKEIIKVFMNHNNIYTLTPMTMGYGESGHPDRLVLINGHLIGVEVKKDINNHHSRPELKAKPNEVMQKRQAGKIRNAGGTWGCYHSGNLQELINDLDKYASIPSTKFTENEKQLLKKLTEV